MKLSLISILSVAVLASQQLASAFVPSGRMAFSITTKTFHSESVHSHQMVASSCSGATSTENIEEPEEEPEIDHEFELAVNRISSLVFRWMSIFDENHGDAAPLLDLMSPEGFAMHLTSTPEPITTIAALQGWFGTVATKVKTVNHLVQSIDVTKLDDGAFGVEIMLRAPGMSTSNVPFNLSSVHNWEVVDYGGQYPKIRRFATKVVNPDGSPLSLDQGASP